MTKPSRRRQPKQVVVKTAKSQITDRDLANDLSEDLRRAMKDDQNCGAVFGAFLRAKPNVQKLVIRKLKPPRRAGRPKRAMPDEAWLLGVEATRAVLSATGGSARVTDTQAIKHMLVRSRMGRAPEVLFAPNSGPGKAEVRRVIDAIARARRARKALK